MIVQKILFRRHLDDEEDLIYVAHKHWSEIIASSVKTAVFGFLVPWTVWFFIPSVFWVAVAWTFIFWCWYLYQLADWYFDAWLATTKSIIDVEWFGIFHNMSTRIPYAEVREIQWEIKGIGGTLLRYGKASISMATGGHVVLENVASPKKVELRIIEIRDDYLRHQKMTQSEALQELLSDMLVDHIEKKGIPYQQPL